MKQQITLSLKKNSIPKMERKNRVQFLGRARIRPRQAPQAHRARRVQVAPARIVTRHHRARVAARQNQKLRKRPHGRRNEKTENQ